MKDQVARIELELGVRLPAEYVRLVSQRSLEQLANLGLFDSATVIARTREQRNGFGGAPMWPDTIISIGDQEDACPYALDCICGGVTQTDHGNLDEEPLARYTSVVELLKELEDAEHEAKASSWRWPFWRR
jgi:hypothetical protein